jgi:ankyrin repeat protein
MLRDAKGNTPLHHAARNGRFLVLDELLTDASKRGRATELVHGTLPNGQNALHLACSKDSISSAIVWFSLVTGCDC